jgi:hypothetical protein
MRHPSDGTLRRLVDEPAGVADADRDHVAGCQTCLTGVAGAQRDAALTGAALHSEVDADVDAGWSRLSQAMAGEAVVRPVKRRWRPALRSPVVAAVAAVALLTGAGAAAAADWLQIFRTERIAPITISQADLLKIPDLSAYGDTKITEVDISQVADAAAAEKATGLEVPQVRDLPRGVSGSPAYQVGTKATAEFTFDAAKAQKAAGHPLPPMPAGLDGSRFRLTAGPGVAAVWNSNSGFPALIVARAVAPAAFSDGIPFATARDYLLTLSGLPEGVREQLRSFSGDGRTLPVHVMAEELTSSATKVDGKPATVFRARDGSVGAVVWVDDGVVTAVAGSLSAGEVLKVAQGL